LVVIGAGSVPGVPHFANFFVLMSGHFGAAAGAAHSLDCLYQTGPEWNARMSPAGRLRSAASRGGTLGEAA